MHRLKSDCGLMDMKNKLTMDNTSQTSNGSQTSVLAGMTLSPPLLSSQGAGWHGIHLEYHREPAGELPEHSFERYHVLCVETIARSCGARKWINGESQDKPIVHGDVFIVPEHIRYREQWDGEIDFITLALEAGFVEQIADESSHTDGIEILPQFPKPDPLICQIAIALKTILELNAATNTLYVETMATALTAHLLQYYSAQQVAIRNYSGGLSKTKLKQIANYIEEHLEQDLSLMELSSVAQMSRHHFARLFKQSMGVSPHQYVIRQRVERAKHLLLREELSVSEVAYQVGFANQSHLSRHFKRLIGVTPKQIRA